MYKKHFGLEETPFSIATDPRYLFMSAKHREALAHLLYGVKSDGGFVLLTGEVGTGKTTVCRCLLEQLPEETAVAFIINPKVTAVELLSTICDELEIEVKGEGNSIKTLVDAINHYLLAANSDGRKVLLIIDEAQNLTPDVLEQIRLLTNLETNRRKLLQIILLGQPELNDLLDRPELRQLSQRITARYHLEPLNRAETRSYIQHRLRVAGRSDNPFPGSLLTTIHRISRGIPRLINVICDRCLLGAYANDQKKVTSAILNRAAKEVLPRTILIRPLTLALAVIGVASVILFLSVSPYSPLAQLFSRDKVKPAAAAETRAPNIAATMNGADPVAELCRLWDIPAPAPGETACDAAAAAGLSCLTSRGSIGTLASLGRPALVRIKTSAGKYKTALMTGRDENGVTIIDAAAVTRLDYADLARRWDGQFTIFWQPPPGYRRPFKQGDSGPGIDWLRRVLTAETGGGNNFDQALAREVKKFQKEHMVVADGIVGPETIIVINRFKQGHGPIFEDKVDVIYP